MGVRADVMMSEDGRSRGFGIVQFSSAKSARKAIASLHDSELEGRTIIVREDRTERTARGGGSFGGSFGGGRGRNRGSGESESDPMYSNSGVTGRNGWMKPDLASFVDDGPPPEPKGSMLR